ncbi:MAG: transcription-repair coupling factor, partial [Bacteroidota bacterium]
MTNDFCSLWERDATALKKLIDGNNKVFLKGLAGSSEAGLCAAYYKFNQTNMLVICEDKEKAAYFMNDLQSYLAIGVEENNSPILFFPRTARIAYEIEQTENANIALRTEVLKKIELAKSPQIIVSYAEALLEKVIAKKELQERSIVFEIGSHYQLDQLDELFNEIEFEKVDYVFEPGQYAIRGGILDVFSYSFEFPYRIEFFDTEIESIR